MSSRSQHDLRKLDASVRLLRCAQAARYLGTSKKQILRLILTRELPYVQVGPHPNSPFLIDRADLDRFVQSHKQR